MAAVDVALLIVLLLVWATLVGGLVWMGRRRPVGPLSESATDAKESEVAGAGPDIERREHEGAIELWWPGGGHLATIRESRAQLAGSALRSPWVRRSVGSLLRRAVPTPRSKARYRISFPPDLMSTISEGGSVDIVLAGGTLARAGVGGTVAGPAVALAAGAAAVSVAQQQRLDRTLVLIEQRLDAMIDRLRDDDHGRLDAAEALLDQLEQRVSVQPSPQLRSELAAARQAADAVYFARRRYVDRLGSAIGDAQAGAGEDGAAQTWADGVLEAVGDTEQLRSELLVYLRALVVRARLATSTAGVLAIDGHIEDATRLLDHTVEDLRDDFYAIYRRLRPLATWAPKRALPWRRKEWDRAHQTVVEVFELMASEVEPALPTTEERPLELDVVTGDDGEVTDVHLSGD